MAQYNASDVLDRVWKDSGSKGSISDSDYACGNSNSDNESEEWSGDSAETSESSDTESGNEAEESNNEPPARNKPNPWRRRGSHIKISLLYSGLLPTWKDHMHFLSLATVEFRYAQLDLGLLITSSLFLNQDLINYFVTETNRFAERFMCGDDVSRRSHANSWHPTDPHEMKQFLGLLKS